MDLAGALELGPDALVSFVGAGGKKTAMARLTDEAQSQGLAAGYTTTTNMPPPDDLPLVVAPPRELRKALRTREAPIAFASARVADPDRVAEKVRGYDPPALDALYGEQSFDWLLVKADGARMREFKAPGENEPAVPRRSTHVVPVASVQVVGEPLSGDSVHRVDRVAALTGLQPGDEIDPRAVATVLASPEGGLKNVPDGATVIPVVNKADTPEQRRLGERILSDVLERAPAVSRGLVTSFHTDYLDVVER